MRKPSTPALAARSRSTRLRLFLLVAAMVVVTLCGSAATSRLGRPFPGFFLEANGIVANAGSAHWSGIRSGVRYGSTLVHADGAPISSTREFARRIDSKPPGTQIAYTFEDQGTTYTANVPLMHFARSQFFESTGLMIFYASVMLLLATAIIYFRPRGPDADPLFSLTILLAFYFATAIDLFGDPWIRRLNFFAEGLLPAALGLVLHRFPVGRRPHRGEPTFLAFMTVLGVAYGAVCNALFFNSPGTLMAIRESFRILLTLAVPAFIAFFWCYFATTETAAVRRRTKFVLLGILGSLVPLITILQATTGLEAFPHNLTTTFFALTPLALGYAAVEADLFDIDRVLRTALGSTVITILVLSVYAVASLTFEYLLADWPPYVHRLVSGVVVLVVVLIFDPSRDRIRAFVDRVYDRRRYEYRDVVATASRKFSAMLDFDDVVRAALELIAEALEPTAAEIHSVLPDGTTERCGLQQAPSDGLSSQRVIVERVASPELTAVLDSIVKSDLVPSTAIKHPSAVNGKSLATTTGSLSVAMRLEGRPVGVLVVGQKRGGGYHTAEDGELLRTIADQLAIALHNAQAYALIDGLNRDLADNYVALEESNFLLKQTQDRLLRAERLAVVGELSSAVAHAIRNPLAGIKMVAEDGEMEFAGHDCVQNFHDISAEAERLNERINNLLNFSKPFEPDPRSVLFREIISRAVEISEAKASQKDVRLRLETTNDDGTATLDPILFEQVVVELIANAIDASPQGGEVLITAGCKDQGGENAWLEVRDEGDGIPIDKLDNLFDLFFTTKKSGTGFGLSTVKKIVERHDGTVVASNAVEGGACFRVVVPLG